jgi:hypothetical protein
MTDQPPPQPPRAPVSRSGLPSSHPGSSSPWRSAASASEESLGLVIARPEGALVDLRLRKFDPRDIEAIKSIPGRRWVPGRKVWTVPNDRTTIELLTRAFGPRLLLGPDAAGDSSSTGRIRQTRPPSSERPAPRPAHIVEDTKSHCFIRLCVVPRRADDCKGILGVTFQYGAGTCEHTSCCKQGILE